YLQHLSLTNFRNYVRLELDFPTRLTLLQGANAQGKTNLLEAIAYLATSRSLLAGADRELVNWLAQDDPLAFMRVRGEVEQKSNRQRLEIVLAPSNRVPQENGLLRYHKQVRINGIKKRALDIIGRLRVVFFLPQDIELVAGPPSVRRRYLDISLCQMDPVYCHHLSAYNRVLAQRNALLRALRERGGAPEQLLFWDERLVEHGSYIIARRQNVLAALELHAYDHHRDLSDGRERLRLRYIPSVDPEHVPSADYQLRLNLSIAEQRAPYGLADPAQIVEVYKAQLLHAHRQEIAAGMSLLGPHRDDFAFIVKGRDLRTYGSRGQQRTAALAIKLAEVQVMTEETGDTPLLLLDDVMSELDRTRRAMLLQLLNRVSQAIITTTEWDPFPLEFRRKARNLTVIEGQIREAELTMT
ncbi:MAG TPA: DNA replication/repair protein RecF, partial [Anaerolineae bacterium]|nr:DNA replication/repair protein RecF [Anaerolineae bacterium]